MTKFDPKEVGGLVKRLRAAEASERIYGSDRMVDLIAEADDAIEALAGEQAVTDAMVEAALVAWINAPSPLDAAMRSALKAAMEAGRHD